MKFCKNLQRVASLTDPEWVPFFCNYKYLKKVVKVLPTVDDTAEGDTTMMRVAPFNETDASQHPSLAVVYGQVRGQPTGERRRQRRRPRQNTSASASSSSSSSSSDDHSSPSPSRRRPRKRLGQIPAEVNFFRLVMKEVNKACKFFERAQDEMIIRQRLIANGMKVLKHRQEQRNRSFDFMHDEQWPNLTRGIFRLHRDLLLLEVFAVMTFISFSKILKKHDKCTGYTTRPTFMSLIVSKANFATYPNVMRMSDDCRMLFQEASRHLLYAMQFRDMREDQRLFLSMVRQMRREGEAATTTTTTTDAAAAQPRSEIAQLLQQQQQRPAPGQQQQQQQRGEQEKEDSPQKRPRIF